MTNVEVDATLDLYDVVAVALHSRGIAMSRVAMVALSSDCKLLQDDGGPIPIRIKGAGKSGVFQATMIPKSSGGMPSAAGA